MDASFQFGDVGVLLNLNPKNKSIVDLIPDMAEGDPEMIDQVLVTHGSGCGSCWRRQAPRCQNSSPRPSCAACSSACATRTTWSSWTAGRGSTTRPWALLDLSDVILALLTLEITNIKNIRLFLEVADQLGYRRGKIKLVLNRADSALGIRVSDVEHSIGRRIDDTIVSDGRSVVYALNRGVPFVSEQSRGPGQPGHHPAGQVRHRRSRQARRATRETGPTQVAVRMALTADRGPAKGGRGEP